MKNGILIVRCGGNNFIKNYIRNNINIGDFIQGLASAQFLDKIDEYIEREHLNRYDGGDVRLIMNGWYMHRPQNWPPSNNITPLFIAFHINSAKTAMLSPQGISYLKRYEPIGCRDYGTRDMLTEVGVDAYFSGCMTLTLGEKYRYQGERDKFYFVDPCSSFKISIATVLKAITMFILNIKMTLSLFNREIHRGEFLLKRVLMIAIFVAEYKKVFGTDILMRAEYISHILKRNKSNEEHFDTAEELVRKYSRAKFVVTSRIHCALPCLGLETPVLYVNHKNQKESSSCRFGGILELFNTIEWDDEKMTLNASSIGDKFDLNNIRQNKDGWRSLCKLLIDKCNLFVGNN